MAKFKKGDKVRVKDNPTRAGGISSLLDPGDIVVVRDSEPDCDGDIRVYTVLDSYDGDYIHEDCVELVVPDIHVGDMVRVYNKRTEITREGVVREIGLRDDHKWLWIGKGYDIAADLNAPEGYDISVLERAERWPDHEGFIRITGGLNTGHRGLARRAIYSDRILIDTDDARTLYEDTVAGQGFDFEYVEG